MVMEIGSLTGRSSWPLLDSRFRTCEKAECPLTTVLALAGYLRPSSERPAWLPAPKTSDGGQPRTAARHRFTGCLARRDWQPPRVARCAPFRHGGDYRAGGDRVPYSAPPTNWIGARLRRFAAEYAPSGGPDEDG